MIGGQSLGQTFRTWLSCFTCNCWLCVDCQPCRCTQQQLQHVSCSSVRGKAALVYPDEALNLFPLDAQYIRGHAETRAIRLSGKVSGPPANQSLGDQKHIVTGL